MDIWVVGLISPCTHFCLWWENVDATGWPCLARFVLNPAMQAQCATKEKQAQHII